VRYRGAKSVVICPDYSEASKFADLWVSVKQGTDAALGMAMGHVILREFHVDRQVPYFVDYAKRYTDMPMLVRWWSRTAGSCRSASSVRRISTAA
jgi:nitrate reductase alpha subunit